MKVILLREVPALGGVGALVEVKEGYARNFLLPRGLAREATEGALRAREERARASGQKQEREGREAEELSRGLTGLVLEIRARVGAEGRLFGAVTSQEVAAALSRRGFGVSKKQVHLDHPIRMEGLHRVQVRLPTGKAVSIEVNVVGTK